MRRRGGSRAGRPSGGRLGRRGPGRGRVVDFAGGSEVAEALAGGGFGDAELAGEVSQGEGTAASSAFPPGQQLQGVDGGRGAAPALAGGAQAGELCGLGAELAVQAEGDFEPVSPAEGSARVGGVEVVFEGDQGDALGGEEVAQIGQVAQGAREVAQGTHEDALDGFRTHGLQESPEPLSRPVGPGAGVSALQDDFPASPGRVSGQAGEDLLDGLPAEIGGRGACVEGD